MSKKIHINSIDLYIIVFVLAYFASAYLSNNIYTYFLSLVFIKKFLPLNKYVIMNYYLPLTSIVLFLFFGNILILNNYIDYSISGMLKLEYFVLFIPIMINFFTVALLKKIQSIRIGLWVLFLGGLIFEMGINLQNMGQLTSLFFIVIVEFVYYLKTKNFIGLTIIFIIMILTTKKQILLSLLLFVFFIHKKYIIHLIPFVIMGGLVMGIFGGIDNRTNAGSSEKRLEKTFTMDFFTPSTETNPRFYLLIYTLPKAFEKSILFGYGLLRYGTPQAYESNRDIEREYLNMSNFVPSEINPNACFPGIAADVGLLTITMQMGIFGLFYYLILLWKNCNIFGGVSFTVILLILLPFFIGGPIVISVIFPFLVGITIASFNVANLNYTRRFQHKLNKGII